MPEEDPYSRVDYRRFVAWPERVRRESPFLMSILETAPDRSVIDLGCGTGEHSRYLAGKGFRVLGLDRSESMLAKAREEPLPPNLRFVLAEIREFEAKVTGKFGAALCLGNTLVHIQEREELELALKQIAGVLEPAGVFLFQILNYERVFKHGIRHLPINFRREEKGEIIFLRLMEPLGEGRVRFCPTTLRYDPGADPPVELVRSRTIELRGWTREELFPVLERTGFAVESVHGDMQGGLLEPHASQDLVVVARLRHGP